MDSKDKLRGFGTQGFEAIIEGTKKDGINCATSEMLIHCSIGNLIPNHVDDLHKLLNTDSFGSCMLPTTTDEIGTITKDMFTDHGISFEIGFGGSEKSFDNTENRYISFCRWRMD